MKKKLIGFIIITLSIIFKTSAISAQSKIFSKKENLRDIGEKTLMVVIENNSLIDLSLKEAVKKTWDLGDYKFCNIEDFEKIKADTSYYFLIRVKGQFKRENDPSMEFITILKGGPDAAMGIDKMYEVLSLPFQALDDGNDYILPFIETYMQIFKTHIKRVQEKKIAATIGISWYSNRLAEIGERTIMINENDLSELINAEEVEKMLKGNGQAVSEDDIEEAVEKKLSKTLVSICIAPQEPQVGSYCYKMLVGADDNELYYYRKQKITDKAPKGFLPEDVKKIGIPFTF